MTERFSGKKVDKMRGHVKGLNPESRRKRSLREKSANHVDDGAKHALGTAILLGGIGTRIALLNAEMREERVKTGILKFAAVVALKNFDIAVKLIFHKSEKANESVMNVGFLS